MPSKGDFILDELVGLNVAAITLDTSVRFLIGEERQHDLRIEIVPFVVIDPTGGKVSVFFDPFTDNPPRGMDTLVALALQAVTSGTAYADGSLDLSFANGMSLHAPGSANQYDAWTLGIWGSILVSMPGGSLG